MGLRSIEDLVAFQLAREYKLAVYALVKAHPGASRAWKFVDQLYGSASSVEANLVEGFHRRNARENRQFVRYALGSLAESQQRVVDGVHRGLYPAAATDRAMRLGYRCRVVTVKYLNSL